MGLSAHQGIVLRPSCVPEKVGVNRNGVSKNSFPLEKRLKPIVTNQQKSVKPKIGDVH